MRNTGPNVEDVPKHVHVLTLWAIDEVQEKLNGNDEGGTSIINDVLPYNVFGSHSNFLFGKTIKKQRKMVIVNEDKSVFG